VDEIITSVTLEPGSRENVDVQTYFQRVLAEAAVNDAVIEREYETGEGFSAIARSTVQHDTSRAVDVVADVLYTIVSSRAAAGGVSDEQLRRYVVNAYEYYIRRGNEREIAAAAERLNGLVEKTPEMREQIGDMFFAAGMKERAMEEYGDVVAQAPDRGEVMEKMSGYYIEEGQAALEDERFDEALAAFQKALNANPLDPQAERYRLQTEAAMREKEARLAASQAALGRANELVSLAEQEALQGLYAEASSLLQQALAAYAEVSDEFPVEAQERIRGEDRVRARLRSYKQDLVANARVFSGSGYEQDLQRLATSGAPELNQKALQELIAREYAAELERVEAHLRDEQ
jgi:tetratricopeptide (TPR) repeat protein